MNFNLFDGQVLHDDQQLLWAGAKGQLEDVHQ